MSEVAKTATYTRAYAESNGFLTLLSDGERLTGAYALGPEAGEWLQQATLAIRARVPLDVLRDTIQPFPTFSEIYVAALKALHGEIKVKCSYGRPGELRSGCPRIGEVADDEIPAGCTGRECLVILVTRIVGLMLHRAGGLYTCLLSTESHPVLLLRLSFG